MVIIDDYRVDAAITEEYTYSAKVTDHPVEDGSNVADNVRLEPLAIKLDCVVSDVPIGAVKQTRDLQIAATPSVAAYQRLRDIFQAKRVISVTVSKGTFDNMILAELTSPVSADNGATFQFSATLKQITFATTLVVRVAAPSGAPEVNLGHKGTVTTQADLDRSLAIVGVVQRKANVPNTGLTQSQIKGGAVALGLKGTK